MGVNQDELPVPRQPDQIDDALHDVQEALRDRRIQLGQYIPVSAWAADQPPSKLGLQPGEALTVEQAILGLVTKSANDAACALGELLGGSEDRFAQMMTLRARALGMNRTSFRNASGLPDSNQWTTARDLATLGRRLVIDFPQPYGYFSVPGFYWHNRMILNHDTMLKSYPGADGMKTGFTDYAGHNLETSAVRGGVRLIGVVACTTASNVERDQQMALLLDNGFNQLHAPAGRFGSGVFALANAAATFALPPARAAEPMAPAARVAAAAPVVAATPAPAIRDHAVQMGAFPAQRIAWNIAQASARLEPDGEPRCSR